MSTTRIVLVFVLVPQFHTMLLLPQHSTPTRKVVAQAVFP